MTGLFTQEELNSASENDKLPCKCEKCGKTIYATKKSILFVQGLSEEEKVRRDRIKCCMPSC